MADQSGGPLSDVDVLRLNRHAINGIGLFEVMRNQSMAALVIVDNPSLSLAHDQRAQRAKLNTCQGILEAVMINIIKVFTRGTQRGLVHQIGQIGTAHACSQACQACQ